MTPEELFQRALASAPAGSDVLMLWVRLPQEQAQTRASLPPGGTESSGAVALAAAAQPAMPPVPADPLAIAEEVARQDPDLALTRRDWWLRLGQTIKLREIERAVDRDLIPAFERGKSRGSRAKLLSVASVIHYLRQRAAVAAGGPEPSWYDYVVRGADAA